VENNTISHLASGRENTREKKTNLGLNVGNEIVARATKDTEDKNPEEDSRSIKAAIQVYQSDSGIGEGANVGDAIRVVVLSRADEGIVATLHAGVDHKTVVQSNLISGANDDTIHETGKL
jgi:hypothetical protein